MANAALEITIPYGGKDYDIRPTFAIISGIETATGRSCTELASEFWAVEPKDYASLTTTAQVLFQILRTCVEPKPKADEIADYLLENGFGQYFQPLGDFCIRALRGHKEHIRMAEEAAKKRELEAAKGGDPNPSGTVDATPKAG